MHKERDVTDIRADVDGFQHFDYAGYALDPRVLVSVTYMVMVFVYEVWQERGFFGTLRSSADSKTLRCGRGTQRNDENFLLILKRLGWTLAMDVLILACVERSKLVALCATFLYIFWREIWLIARTRWASKASRGFHLKERLGLKYLEVHGRYQDVGVSFLHCLLVFFAQSMLMVYYVADVSVLVGELDRKAYMFWFSSIPIQFMTYEQMVPDRDIEAEFWGYVMDNLNAERMHLETVVTGARIRAPGKPELWMRFLLSRISHAVYLQIIIFTLPLQLMPSETGLDFVKDVFAIVFIPGLDFYSEAKQYKVLMGAEQ